MLSASEVKCVRRSDAEAGVDLCCLQINRLGHRQRRELIEQCAVRSFQDRVAALDRANKTFAFHQR